MKNFLSKQEGTILILSVIVFFITSAFAAALIFPTLAQHNSTQYAEEKMQALYIAQAALAKALDAIRLKLETTKTVPLGALVGTKTNFVGYPVADKSQGEHFAEIVVDTTLNPPFGLHVINAVGHFRRADCTLEATVTFKVTEAKFSPDRAILAGPGLKLSGNVSVLGSSGSVHTNETLVLGGSAINIVELASAVNGITGSKAGVASFEENADPIAIPNISPQDYKEEMEHTLEKIAGTQTVKATDNTTGAVTVVLVNGVYRGWTLTGFDSTGTPLWDYKGSTAIHGSYWMEGHVTISGNVKEGVGNKVRPWQVSVVSTGHIGVTGTPLITPKHETNTVFIAGTDLKLNGNSSTSFEGFYAAREQFNVSGNPKIFGSVYVQSVEDKDNFVTLQTIDGVPSVVISGTPKFIYNGGITTFLEDPKPEETILKGIEISYAIK